MTDDLPTPPLPDDDREDAGCGSVNGLLRGGGWWAALASTTASGLPAADSPLSTRAARPASRRRSSPAGRPRPGRRRWPSSTAVGHQAVHGLGPLVAGERQGDRHHGGVAVDGDARDHPEVHDRTPQRRAPRRPPGRLGPRSRRPLGHLSHSAPWYVGISTTAIGRIPTVVPATPNPTQAAEHATIAEADRPLTSDEFNARGRRGHERVRRPDPPRDLPLRSRRRHRGRHRVGRRRAVRAAPERRPPSPREAHGGGYLVVEVGRPRPTPRSRTAGRPSKRYCAVELDSTFSLPLKHDDVLSGLLARALDALGPDDAARLADDVGYEYGQSLAARMDPSAGHRSVRAAIGAVADALTAHGFAAHTEEHGGRLSIVSECCPFGDTATPVPARGVRARPRHDPRDARRALRRDVARVRREPARRRRPLRRPRLTPCPSWHAPTSTTPRRRRSAPPRSRRCSRTSKATPAIPVGCTRRAAPPGSRSRSRASRSPRCSARAHARSCSRRPAPRP